MSPIDEPKIPIPHVPRRIGLDPPPHPKTVWRWVLHGVGSPPVRLATVKVGGRRYTTAAALEAFVRALSAGRVAPPPERGASGPRAAAVRQAEREMEKEEF